MTTSLFNAAETWDKVYKAFQAINFTAYDYDAVKQSLLDYLKLYYPENFNDYIESSQLIAIIETFAYVSEQLSYRVDMTGHENSWADAARKQSILRLAKYISYSATRNLPLRGLVKITSISISESLLDSQSNQLSNRVIKWNDVNNPLWREQFFLVMNKVLTQPYGNPFKSFQVSDSIFQQYEFNNIVETSSANSSFKNGVIKYRISVDGQDLLFELVPADVDANGPLERSPNPLLNFNVLYADDGYGDASDMTGFMMYTKQGTLAKLPYVFDIKLPNQVLDIKMDNVNNVDVWVQQVDAQGTVLTEWTEVPTVAGSNLVFNTIASQTKYEVETMENDNIRLIFGDDDFAAIPTGIFNIWVRASASGSSTVAQSAVVDQSATFLYTSTLGQQQSCSLTYSLTSALENSSQSEDIEHIRSSAPSAYYSQARMVNGQDYNSFPLKDPSILRLYAVNRTFSGQPKYIDWNDASGAYQNVKLFGDDLRLYYDVEATTQVSNISSRSMIDSVLEPFLSDASLGNLISYAFYTTAVNTGLNSAFIVPRTKFIEDSTQIVNGQALQEKTLIQGALDRHWYGEPDAIVQLDANLSGNSSLSRSNYGLITTDTDQRIYDSNLKMVVQNASTGVYMLIPTANNVSGIQESAYRQHRFGISFNPNRAFASNLRINHYVTSPASITNGNVIGIADVLQPTVADTYTITINDAVNGSFTVYSSVLGYQPSGQVGVNYTNGILSFIIGFPSGVNTTLTVGDSFVIQISYDGANWAPTILTTANLTGSFSLIDESLLVANAETLPYAVDDPLRSWFMIIERVDDPASGLVSYWKITSRSFNLSAESPTTNFWFNSNATIVDPGTKLPVADVVKILKSNLNQALTKAIGVDYVFSVNGSVLYSNGTVNYKALSIAPFNTQNTFYSGTGSANNPVEFLQFIGTSDYVYFSVDPATGILTPIPASPFLTSLTYVNDISGNYVRKLGRDNLDFMWQHFTPNDNLIDPSPSNIHDMYILTRGYYSDVLSYLNGTLAAMPMLPTSLNLRSSYATMLESAMLSDSVVLHPGKIKLLFGSLAVPELRAKFRVVQSPNGTLTANQVIAQVLSIINQYFVIDNWDFGQEFFAQNLCSVIQQQLGSEITTAVLVPVFPTNYFGDLFYLKSGPDEVFVSCAQLSDIEIITSIDRLTLNQKQ